MHLFRFIFALLLSAGILTAQAADFALTERHINSFISSLQDFDSFEDEIEDAVDDAEFLGMLDDDMDVTELFSRMLIGLQNQSDSQSFKLLEDFAKKHGFNDAVEWANTSIRVTTAVLAISMESVEAEMAEQMAAMLKEFEDSGMSEEQKQQMLAFVGLGMTMTEQFTKAAAPEDVAAVRPHFERLQQLFEQMD